MLRLLLVPLLGGVIGYITNDIAIKMLFRPREAVYLGSWRLPFTPGLIPRQKERIAASLGEVVSEQLLDEETLRASIFSEEAVGALREHVRRFLESYAECGDTVEETGERLLGISRYKAFTQRAEEALRGLLLRKLRESDIGAEIVRHCMNRLREPLGIGSNSPLFRQVLAQLEASLGAAIQEVILDMAPGLVRDELHAYFEELGDTRLCDLCERHRERLPAIADGVALLYRRLLGDNLGKLLEAVNVSGIVRNKIAAFDAAQLETLILGIMRRELRAIVWLGALLGLLMGSLNLLLL